MKLLTESHTQDVGASRYGWMTWLGFATDFDGTIATDGVVDEPTRAALFGLRGGGIKTFLVTGRELAEFKALNVFLPMFDMIVAENGAVLFDPETGETRTLGEPPSEAFVAELQRRGVPLSKGAAIVATVEPHEVVVLEVIKTMGLELHVIFNKGAVMILPSGINKASGLREALKLHGLDASDVIGIGDGENDHALLEMCGLPVAVANAVPTLKEKAARVTHFNAGAGVVELIKSLLHGDLDKYPRVENAK